MPRKPARRRSSKRISKAKKKALKREKLKKTLSVAALVIVSAVFLLSYSFYKELTSKYASAFSSSSHDILSQKIYSVVVISVDDFSADPIKVKTIDLYIFDKDTLKLIKYHIPLQTTVDVPGEYSVEPFANIFALGNLKDNNLSEGAELVSRSVEKLFAFPVDRYLVVEGRGEEALVSLLNGKLLLNKENFNLDELKESVKTNLSLREFFDLYNLSRSLPGDRIIEKDLSQTYLDSPSLLDEELRDLTFDTELSKEQKSLAVLNGSSSPGVAAYGSRLLENYGGRVVAVSNASKQYDKSIIITDDTMSESTRIVSRLFGIENIVLKSNLQDFSETEIDRSDITVILGLDFARSL
jgi:hypothetical protein